MKKNPILSQLHIRHFSSMFLLSILFSCNQQEVDKKTNNTVVNVRETKGYVIPKENLKPPQVVLLASMPKPLNIEVPAKTGSSYSIHQNGKETKIDLLPPEIKHAGFLYVMQNYTTNDGLALDEILSGIEDKAGNMWFGTWGGGVSRYDGKAFTNFTSTMGLAEDEVFSLLEDKQGNLWFGTLGGGVSRYDGIIFTTYKKEQGLVNDNVKNIFEDKTGNLWFGTDGGVSRYNDMSFISYTKEHGLVDNGVSCILEDKAGNLWFGTNGGISRYDGNTFTNYTTSQGLVNDKVTSILEDKAGHLWFGTKGGVSRYDGKTFENYTVEQGLADDIVLCILEDNDGILWFGTNQKGVSSYDGKSFSTLTKAQGLSNNTIKSMLKDKTGNIWFSTGGGGVCRYDGKAFTNYTSEQGLTGGFVRSILRDKAGDLWIGTDKGGVVRYDGKTYTYYTKNQGLSDNTVYSIYEDKVGDLWFGTKVGLNRYDGKSFTTFTNLQGLVNNEIRYIHQDKKGNFWFGTSDGVSKYDGTAFTNYTDEQGLVGNFVTSIIEDKAGDLWFSTWGDGVSRYDGQSFTTYTKEQGLASNVIRCMLEDNIGNLWFAVEGGLSRYDGKSFISYTMSQGLPDNSLWQLTKTDQEDILVGTNLGLALLKGFSPTSALQVGKIDVPAQNNLTNEELGNYKPVFEIYNTKTGYPVKDEGAGQNSMYLDKIGIIWIGTASDKTGLVRFDYAALHKSKTPPNVFIQALKIDNENIIWEDLLKLKTKKQDLVTKKNEITVPPNIAEEILVTGGVFTVDKRNIMRQKFGDIKFDHIAKFYPVPENLRLPHSHNKITFEFAAIEPARPQDVLYQYKLEGYDKDWSPPSNSTAATFGNIFEGVYIFKIKAQSPYGVWSEPIIYTFTVLPPWYRTLWAYGLYAISSITGIYLFFLWRTAALRKKFEETQRLYVASERFVPKQFLKLLRKEHLEDVQLGDSVKQKISALFADIRGFTTLAESLTPEQTTTFLNTYMYHMVPIIQDNQGFVLQFLGDGIFAMFPESPSDAVDAAVGMTRALGGFNKEIQAQGFSPVTVGIGINSGDAMICTLGVKERMEASVVSDAINTASRVEGLNKFYKTQLLISQEVYRQLKNPDQYLIRIVDKVVLKGKTVSMSIYEVQSLPDGEALVIERRYILLFSEAFAAYEKGDFKKAITVFENCLKQKSSDMIVKILLERSFEFQKNGAPKDWDGTIILHEK